MTFTVNPVVSVVFTSVMPKITVQNQVIECEVGDNLRKVLLKHGIPLYNGKAQIINCMGIGTCGTCAVEIEGKVSEANWKDQLRRKLPPHDICKNRRLACQTKVLGDLTVKKYRGFWGHQDQRLF